MSIQYQLESLVDAIRSGALNGKEAYIIAFPSVSLKSSNPKEVSPMDIYEHLPHGNYYQHYARSNKMGKPGTFSIHADTTGGGLPAVINFYCRIYPGTKVFPNDNPVLRTRWFSEIMGELTSTRGLKSIYLQFPDGYFTEQNIQALEDFIKTYELNGGGKPTIYVRGCAPARRMEEPGCAPARRMEEPGCAPSRRMEEPGCAPSRRMEEPGCAPARRMEEPGCKPPQDVPVLQFTEDQLVKEILYEVDIIRYAIQPSVSKASDSETLPPLLTYFPAGWEAITGDQRLQELAVEVYSALAPVWDNPELYPARSDIFNAFSYLQGQVPRVVILGQDPYHGPGQAHGLSFSVNPGIAIPPSLRNIYKALENDADLMPVFRAPRHGHLLKWAEQGVIMLNSSLTVLRGQANCHQKIWDRFTDRLIWLIASKYQNVVFVLWGTAAKSKRTLISSNGHLILEYNHPSPMVKNNDFATGCKHFSQINRFLQEKGIPAIDWTL